MYENMIKKPLTNNQVSDLANALVEGMRFCDNNVEYPKLSDIESDSGVPAEWFYPIYNGSNSFSELSAIVLYTTQEAMHEELGELFLGIGLVEMKHYDKISDVIMSLGGKITQKYDDTKVVVGNNAKVALQVALQGEKDTIEFYELLSEKINKVSESKTTKTILQLISKLVADEKVHEKLLSERLSKLLIDEDK
jgi:bacterioferritin (cytochrome b1)